MGYIFALVAVLLSQRPSYFTIAEKLSTLASKNPALLEAVDYGESALGKPLRLLVLAKKKPFSKRPVLLMTGNTHGNEYLHIEDRLPEALLKKAHSGRLKTFLDVGGAIVFVPVVNPDGFEKNLRENANGVDLNRDWDLKTAHHSGFREVETKSLADVLRKFRDERGFEFEVTVDYHCCRGALLSPWSHKVDALPASDVSRHKEVARLATDLLHIPTGTTLELMGYSALGTTKDYFYSTFGARAFTFEGRAKTERAFFEDHLHFWESIAGLVGNYAVASKRTLAMREIPALSIVTP